MVGEKGQPLLVPDRDQGDVWQWTSVLQSFASDHEAAGAY